MGTARVRTRTIAVLAIGALVVVEACSGSTSRQAVQRPAVPVPHVNHISSVPDLDTHAWIKLWRTTPGSSAHRCVDVGTRAAVRSGEFIVGNFAGYIESWDGTPGNSKLAYIPLYPPDYATGHAGDIPLPNVAAQRLDTSSDPINPAHLGPAWAQNGMFFYASGTLLPERGRWRLTAELGRNRGCFDLTL